MNDSSTPPLFASSFAGAVARVRRRLATRALLTGLCAGGVIGAALLGLRVAGAPLPPAAALLGPLGGLVWGGWRAHRRRWSTREVASYLDARLGLPEVVLTALEPTPSTQTAAAVALQTLPTTALPRWTTPRLVAGLLATGVASVALAATPPRHTTLAAATVQLASPAPSLEKLAALAELRARDDDEQARREALVQRARELEAALRQGMPRDEATARLGALRDAIDQERRTLGKTGSAESIEAATRALAAGSKNLADALRERNLAAFDEELERLAAAREKSDRESAKKALREAEEAARRAGNQELAKTLGESADALEQRARRNQALRDFAEALQDSGRNELGPRSEQLERSGSDADAQKLADSMADALRDMTDAQRQKLAENLKKLAQQGGGAGSSAAGKPLDAESLRKQLEQLAEADLEIDEAKRDRGFGDAERNLDDAERELGGVKPGAGGGGALAGKGSGGAAGQGSAGHGAGGGGAGSGGGGGAGSGGAGEHAGATAELDSESLRARARARLDGKLPMQAGVTVTGPGGVGEQPRLAPLEMSASERAQQLSGIDDGELPAEYREQVRRYFTPD